MCGADSTPQPPTPMFKLTFHIFMTPSLHCLVIQKGGRASVSFLNKEDNRVDTCYQLLVKKGEGCSLLPTSASCRRSLLIGFYTVQNMLVPQFKMQYKAELISFLF